MSRRGVHGILAVILLLGVVGAGAIAVKWFTRDRVAVASYRVDGPPSLDSAKLIEVEREAMTSDAVLKPVIADLDLVSRGGLDGEDEALAHGREKLKMFEGIEPGQVRLLYRDRRQERALEVLRAITASYIEMRGRQGALNTPPSREP
jgi:uncharacterized protein involved in exopolysaccharide biosynthesis